MSLFKKKIVSFGNGKIVALKDIPDAAFSSGALGAGLGIDLTDNEVYAPVDGTVSMVFPTNHALGIVTAEGMELLIHIGVDTVSLNGEGFTGHVKSGDKITKGTKLITADFDFIRSKNLPTVTIFVVSDSKGKKVTFKTEGDAVVNDTVIATY